MKHGFKSQCEKRSLKIRTELGLGPTDPLKAIDLATHIEAVVWSAADVEDVLPEDLNQLTNVDPDSWSAFTIKVSHRDLIVYNPSQSAPRINSVIMHELSHILLGHTLANVLTTPEGYVVPSHYDQEQEDEADWLAGTLLLPRPALLKVLENDLNTKLICEKFLVSKQMLQWRTRMTGIKHQLKNRKRRVSTRS